MALPILKSTPGRPNTVGTLAADVLPHRFGRGAAAEKADPAVCGVSQPPGPPPPPPLPPPRVGPGKRSRLPDPGDEDKKAESWRPCLLRGCDWKPDVAGGLSKAPPLLPVPQPLRNDEREHDWGGLSPQRFHSAFLRIFSYSFTAISREGREGWGREV